MVLVQIWDHFIIVKWQKWYHLPLLVLCLSTKPIHCPQHPRDHLQPQHLSHLLLFLLSPLLLLLHLHLHLLFFLKRPSRPSAAISWTMYSCQASRLVCTRKLAPVNSIGLKANLIFQQTRVSDRDIIRVMQTSRPVQSISCNVRWSFCLSVCPPWQEATKYLSLNLGPHNLSIYNYNISCNFGHLRHIAVN